MKNERIPIMVVVAMCFLALYVLFGLFACSSVVPTQPEVEGYRENPLTTQQYEPPTVQEEPFNIAITGQLSDSNIGVFYLPALLAAREWERIIVEGLPDVGNVDDITIELKWGGERGGFLASAYPSLRHLRHGSGLPYYGVVTFYRPLSNYNFGDIQKIIFHEIGHALGFDFYVLSQHTPDAKIETINGAYFFSGETAIDEYRKVLYQHQGEKMAYAIPGLLVPVHADGFHWRHPALQWDVMSPFFSTDNVVTGVTIGAFADMGYVVDMSQAKEPAPTRLAKPAIGRPIFRCDGGRLVPHSAPPAVSLELPFLLDPH